MNLPNRLTIFRIAIIPVFMIFILIDNFWANVSALSVFIIASLTDTYDGWLARKYKIITNFGRFMDPLADKLLVSAAFICFVEIKELGIPAWLIVLIISREFIITGLRSVAAARGRVIAADLAGKAKTTTQMVAIVVILAILLVNSSLTKFWSLTPQSLLSKGGWFYGLGLFVIKGPFYLVVVSAILTAISGVSFILKNKFLLKDID